MIAEAIPGLTSVDDLAWLRTQAAYRQTIIELGPFRGRSTRALADTCRGHIYAIDNWNARINHGRPDTVARAACQANLADLPRVTLIEHDSRSGVPPLLAGAVIDMLWIDAGHEYEDVASDIATYAPLVQRGGLVSGHDYNAWHPGVVRAVDEAYGHRVHSLGIHRSIWWVNV